MKWYIFDQDVIDFLSNGGKFDLLPFSWGEETEADFPQWPSALLEHKPVQRDFSAEPLPNFAAGLVIYNGPEALTLGENIYAVPWFWLAQPRA